MDDGLTFDDVAGLIEIEKMLRERLEALPQVARAELLHVLLLPDFERAERIGDFWANPATRGFAELLIDLEEDWTARAVIVGMLREHGQASPGN